MTVQRALLACPQIDARTRRQVAAALRASGVEVTVAADAHAAVRAVDALRFDLVVADVRSRLRDGRALLVEVANRHPELATCAVADAPRFETARAAMRMGAVDVLAPPIDPKAVAEAVERAGRRRRRGTGDRVGGGPAADLGEDRSRPGRPVTLAESERAAILRTLEETHGNRTESARRLGISVRTLWNRLKRYEEEGVVLPPPARGRHRARARAGGGAR